MKKKNLVIYKMILTALFTAMSFVGVFIKIPLPTGFIHLGNFFCILGSLLCGGLIGGFAGGVGMMFADIALGYTWATFVRTLLAKFVMGFVAGYLFKIVCNKKIKGSLLIIISLIITSIFLIGSFFMKFKNEELALYSKIFLATFALLLLITLIVGVKINDLVKKAIFVTVIGILCNVIIEFNLRAIFYTILGKYTYSNALLISIGKLPGNIITSVITIIFIAGLYYPLYLGTRKINKLNYVKEDNN